MHQDEILVVDDDTSVLEQVREELAQERFAVETAVSIPQAIERLAQDPMPDAMVLDISLGGAATAPDLPDDGLGLLKWVRKAVDIPIIMLSATQAEIVKVMALNMGADDYVTKPFSPQELAARLKAVLRRGGSAQSTTGPLKCGPLRIDSTRHEVYKDGTLVDLTLREFRVLETLAQAAGRVLTRAQIMDAAWGPGHYSVERTIDVHVRHLREKLEADPSRPEIILTVRGVGYRFGLTESKAEANAQPPPAGLQHFVQALAI